MSSLYVSDILDPKRNNFTLLRLLAALAVLIDHAIFLRSGLKSDEIFAGSSLYTLGDHAVNLFFVLSGLTVARSLDRTPDIVSFLTARALRIFPALVVCSAVLIMLGMVVSECSVGHYLADTRVAAYLLKTLSLISSGSAELPGVFAGNPYPFVVNASIWTLKFEALCYVLLALIGLLLSNKISIVRLLPVTWCVAGGFLMYRYGEHLNPLDQLARFWICFSAGVSLFVFRDWVRISGAIAIVLGLFEWFTLGTALERVVAPLAVGYAAVWFGSLPGSKLRDFSNRNDLSYGTYIFGWPISQTLVFVFPKIGLFLLIAFSMVLALGIATLSWYLIEKPALALRSRCALHIRRCAAAIRGHIARKQARSAPS